MPLADEKTAPPRKGPLCTVCAALKAIPVEDAVTLVKWLSNPNLRYSQVEERFGAYRDKYLTDMPELPFIADSTFRKHASGKCTARTKLR